MFSILLLSEFNFPLSRGGEALEDKMESPVEEFYKDKTVFITGATGFMGKVVKQLVLANISQS